MSTLAGCIQGIGMLGPGIADWGAARALLTGAEPYVAAPTVLPPPAVLPPAERRRAGRVIRLALAAGAEALGAATDTAAASSAAVTSAADYARQLPTVFTSSGGDGDNCHELCVTLASGDRQISPTRFHNSVHNAAAGYWSIAYGCTSASTSLCAGDASFGAGLVEALSQLACGAPAVLLLAYDANYPQPLYAMRPIPDAFGVALLLVAPASAPELPRLQVALSDAPVTPMEQSAFESLRASIPAARSLPLLECLASRHGGTVILDYLDSVRLTVEVQP